MSSKGKEARAEQMAYWENKLDQRLSDLAEKRLPRERIAKDTVIRNIRAKIRKTNRRLTAISQLEKKAEQMARKKAEKEAEPGKEKPKKKKPVSEKAPAISKRQQKKKRKKEGKASEKAGK